MGRDDFRSIDQRRPWPAYGLILTNDGTVNSNYHALDIKMNRRFSGGLTYLVGFTWSKAIDNGSGVRVRGGDDENPTDNYNLRTERGLSQFHTGRRLVTSVLYELPFGLGKPFGNRPGLLEKMIGGWQLGSILTFSDGTPLRVGGIGDRRSVETSNFPDATGISPVPKKLLSSEFLEYCCLRHRQLTASISAGQRRTQRLAIAGCFRALGFVVE